MKTILSPQSGKSTSTSSLGMLLMLLLVAAIVLMVLFMDPFQTTSAGTGVSLNIRQLVEQVLNTIRTLVSR